MSEKMSRYERQALAEMATTYKDKFYFWRQASVAKLLKRGFAEPDPKCKGSFRLTAAGFAAYDALP